MWLVLTFVPSEKRYQHFLNTEQCGQIGVVCCATKIATNDQMLSWLQNNVFLCCVRERKYAADTRCTVIPQQTLSTKALSLKPLWSALQLLKCMNHLSNCIHITQKHCNYHFITKSIHHHQPRLLCCCLTAPIYQYTILAVIYKNIKCWAHKWSKKSVCCRLRVWKLMMLQPSVFALKEGEVGHGEMIGKGYIFQFIKELMDTRKFLT